MALSLAADIQRECLTCDICKSQFVRPKSLPCLHSFCADCLRRYMHIKLSRYLPCPICRRKFKVPRKGTSYMPTNHFINGIADVIDKHLSQHVLKALDQESCKLFNEDDPHEVNLLSRFVGNSFDEGPANFTEAGTNDNVGSSGQAMIQSDGSPIILVAEASTGPLVPSMISTIQPYIPCSEDSTNLNQSISGFCDPSPNMIWIQNFSSPGQLPNCEALDFWVTQHLPDPNMVHQFGRYSLESTDMTAPMNFVISKDGDVIISDLRENRILIQDRNGRFLVTFRCFEEIRSVAITTDKMILVTVVSSKTDLLHCFNIQGQLLAIIPKEPFDQKPQGLHIDQNNEIYVSVLDTGNILHLPNMQNQSENGSESQQYAKCKIRNDGSLKTPLYMATGMDGNILVSDAENCNIRVYNVAGKFLFEFGAKDSTLKSPRGICTDQANNILVADADNRAVLLFDQVGNYTKALVRYPKLQNNGFCLFPIDVAVWNNELFVLVIGPFYCKIRIYKYRPGCNQGDMQTSVCSLM